MILHGVDIYIWSATTPDVPKEFGPFKLILISNRGTRVWPPPAPDIDLLDWPRCRYVCDDPVTDAQIDQLVIKITELGFKWNKCQKLHWAADGTKLYSEPY